MKVKDWMCSTACIVNPAMRVEVALQVMAHEHIMHLPVVANGRLVGLVSKTALLRFMPSEATTLSRWELPELLQHVTVARAIDHPPCSLSPDAYLKDAARLMREQCVDMLPVVADGVVVGILTTDALLEVLQVVLLGK